LVGHRSPLRSLSAETSAQRLARRKTMPLPHLTPNQDGPDANAPPASSLVAPGSPFGLIASGSWPPKLAEPGRESAKVRTLLLAPRLAFRGSKRANWDDARTYREPAANPLRASSASCRQGIVRLMAGGAGSSAR